MHLTYGTYRYKGEEYTSYSIAESYREGKTVRKRILFPLGKLSETQVEQIRLILKIVKGNKILEGGNIPPRRLDRQSRLSLRSSKSSLLPSFF